MGPDQVAEGLPTVGACCARLADLDASLETWRTKIRPFPTQDLSAAPRLDGAPADPDDQFEFNDDGSLKAQSQQNIIIALRELRVELTYHEFTQQVFLVVTSMKRRRQETEPLTDINERRLRLILESHFRFLPPKDFFRDVLLNEATKRSYQIASWSLSAILIGLSAQTSLPSTAQD